MLRRSRSAAGMRAARRRRRARRRRATCQIRCRFTGLLIGPPPAIRASLTAATTCSCTLGADPGPQRQRQVLRARRARSREVTLGVAERAERGLQVERSRVVDLRCDRRPLTGARGSGRARASGRRRRGRRGPARPQAARTHSPRPSSRVARRRLAPQPVPLLELWQEEAERSRLELVEPRVVADELECLLRLRAVEAEQPDPLGEVGVAAS